VIRVVLADDQALVRSGLRALLANSDDILIVGDASDGRETIAVVARTQPMSCSWTFGCPASTESLLFNGLRRIRVCPT
jgi:DNA-binding NarL/FixJ family response regulator